MQKERGRGLPIQFSKKLLLKCIRASLTKISAILSFCLSVVVEKTPKSGAKRPDFGIFSRFCVENHENQVNFSDFQGFSEIFRRNFLEKNFISRNRENSHVPKMRVFGVNFQPIFVIFR